jgi:hypothetical protein
MRFVAADADIGCRTMIGCHESEKLPPLPSAGAPSSQ